MPLPAVRKRNKGGGISFGRKRRRAVRKDREADEDDSQFALTRFVPMLQEVVEDAGGWASVLGATPAARLAGSRERRTGRPARLCLFGCTGRDAEMRLVSSDLRTGWGRLPLCLCSCLHLHVGACSAGPDSVPTGVWLC